MRCFFGSEIRNDGLTRHILVTAPEVVLRPRFPAAVSARHLTVQRLADVLCEALGNLLPDRAVAAAHVSFPAFIVQATDPRTCRLTFLTDILGGGGGARRGCDGDHGIDTYTSSCAILPVEVAELEYPWLIERSELIEGSGGSGRAQGGWAIRRDYRLLADEAEGPYYVEQTNPSFAARGRDGGGPGARPPRSCAAPTPNPRSRFRARATSASSTATSSPSSARAAAASAADRSRVKPGGSRRPNCSSVARLGSCPTPGAALTHVLQSDSKSRLQRGGSHVEPGVSVRCCGVWLPRQGGLPHASLRGRRRTASLPGSPE